MDDIVEDSTKPVSKREPMMDGSGIYTVARQRAEEMLGSQVQHPFGPDWEVFKVRGKVFLLLTAVTGQEQMIVKAEPEDCQALQQQYSFIAPGYHMNKRHWVSVYPHADLHQRLIEELVTDSYRMVVEKLPKTQCPIDPTSLG
ncbi:MmcQ/YjbR family DNA-binding protein [Corynebacterium tuberculostearicum]|uniref:MmcQ/YjbR family DNA-binding protein n=1 Tax=Corynebacterium TaxID=1716 RepID=UPI001EF2DEA7|nr:MULTISPECIES: MmcQ/YjbR family DNA-binding protein [Corynebacterium]MCG7461975.1 MmcQ/YjbR family DNA-binding protein [Corynebacterium sp. ACRPF]MCG7465557.1 MmcQ/YjbR family DNA-binding protein [Corynebacterium sp. ACRPJ]MDV2418114.1 MmcQ/YjbR family DNA-binding protein [Corynebacterium tuberculostearicum]MDV2428566.1 MmcQ/YjbR family DNA-binding protein [Corynebacterium tuberculostearicum]MDV2431186.1 MmcQ/YjbR family DNA-binding protein [Corynebacterium tuberculostearicum]